MYSDNIKTYTENEVRDIVTIIIKVVMDIVAEHVTEEQAERIIEHFKAFDNGATGLWN